MYVYVLNYDNTPMNPVHPAVARKMLKTGNWKVKRNIPFTVKSLVQLEQDVEPVNLGVKFNGDSLQSAAVSESGKVLYLANTDTSESNNVKSKMERRSNYRRTRRARKLRYRAPRFDNRTKKNTITPTVRSKTNNVVREVNFCKKILNIVNVNISGKKYNPDNLSDNVSKKSEEWIDIAKATYEKDGYKCKVCGGKSGDFQLHAHHIIPESEGGNSNPSNLVTLCKSCHVKLHKGEIDLKGKRLKKEWKSDARTQRLHILKLLPKFISNLNYIFGSRILKKRRELSIYHNNLLDAVILAGGSYLPMKSYSKRNLQKIDYQQTKGVRSQMKLLTGKYKGFRKFDKVLFNNITCWVKGKYATGYFILMDFLGKKIPFKPMAKNTSVKKLGARKSQIIIEEHTVNIC